MNSSKSSIIIQDEPVYKSELASELTDYLAVSITENFIPVATSATALGDSILYQTNSKLSIGMGDTEALARLHIQGLGSTSFTNALRVDSATVDNLFVVNDDGNIGVNTTPSLARFTIRASASNNALRLDDVNGQAMFTVNNGGVFIIGPQGLLQLQSNGGVQPKISFTYDGGASLCGSIEGTNNTLAVNTPFLHLAANTTLISSTFMYPLARLHIKGAGSTSSTNALIVDSATVDNLFVVRDDGQVSLGALTQDDALTQILVRDSSTGLLKYRASSTLGITGSGTANFLTKWSSAAGITNSLIQDNGTNIGLGSAPNASVRAFMSTALPYGMYIENGYTAGHCYGMRIDAYGSNTNTNYGLVLSAVNGAENIALNAQNGSVIVANGSLAVGSSSVPTTSKVFISSNTTPDGIYHQHGASTGTVRGYHNYLYSNNPTGSSRGISTQVYGAATTYGVEANIGNLLAGSTNFGYHTTVTGGAATSNNYGYYANLIGTSALSIGGFFSAQGGINNYAIIVPADGGSIGFGTSTPAAKVHIKGAGSTSSTNALIVDSATVDNLFVVRDDGNIGVSTTPAARLHIKGVDSSHLTAAFRIDSATQNNLLTVMNNGGTSIASSLNVNARAVIGTDWIGNTDTLSLVAGDGGTAGQQLPLFTLRRKDNPAKIIMRIYGITWDGGAEANTHSVIEMFNSNVGIITSLHTGVDSYINSGTSLKLGIGINVPTAKVDISNATGYNQFRLRTTYTPTGSADANGNTGDIAWDDDYMYIKTSTGWKRNVLSTF